MRVRHDPGQKASVWCRVWQGADVSAFRATVTVHSGTTVRLVMGTADLKDGIDVELSIDSSFKLHLSDAVGADRFSAGRDVTLRRDRPTEVVVVVDRDGVVHVYVDKVHITSLPHQDFGRAVVAVGVVDEDQLVEATFADITVWGMPLGS